MSLVPQPQSRFLAKVTKQDMAERLEKMPVADKLFRRKFAVLVPAAYLYSDEDFARGVPVTDDKDRDRKAANELERTFMAIAPDDSNPGPNILEFFENDIPCSFCEPNDVMAVYKILMEHFKEMARYLNEEPLMGKEKRERILGDLSRFDALASKLHPTAHTLFPKHLGTDSVEFRLRQVLKPRMGTLGIDAALPKEQEVPEYQGYTTGISRQLLKGNKRWE